MVQSCERHIELSASCWTIPLVSRLAYLIHQPTVRHHQTITSPPSHVRVIGVVAYVAMMCVVRRLPRRRAVRRVPCRWCHRRRRLCGTVDVGSGMNLGRVLWHGVGIICVAAWQDVSESNRFPAQLLSNMHT